MRTLLGVLALGRDRWRGFVVVAVLVSLGAMAPIVEPWIYRALVNDLAESWAWSSSWRCRSTPS